jgi:hypothetical protein
MNKHAEPQRTQARGDYLRIQTGADCIASPHTFHGDDWGGGFRERRVVCFHLVSPYDAYVAMARAATLTNVTWPPASAATSAPHPANAADRSKAPVRRLR